VSLKTSTHQLKVIVKKLTQCQEPRSTGKISPKIANFTAHLDSFPMKRLFCLFSILSLLFVTTSRTSMADEGLWLPFLLEEHNQHRMQEMGMQISAEDIYSLNQSSMKDAIVLFGRGCTGSIVSDQGLVFTNHHCGFGSIRNHSTVENNYLDEGFWATNLDEELPNPGLTITLLKQMEEVTDSILRGVEPAMTESQRDFMIKKNSERIINYAKKNSPYNAFVRAFYNGNQFFLIYTETFRDIRLVGTPPYSIGKFGGSTDNWMWPRHTGDFAVFRIYANAENQPADYSEENIPYKPAYYLPISLKGVSEGDFTFVYGYPGRTNVYLPSQAVKLIAEVTNPHKVRLRQQRLDVFDKYMQTDPQIRIQYASKDAGVANGWKKMIGESNGVRRLDAINKKAKLEEAFQEWALAGDEQRKARYAKLLPSFAEAYELLAPYALAADYMNEAGRAIELIGFASQFRFLYEASQEKDVTEAYIQNLLKRYEQRTESFFKDYHEPIDREVAQKLLQLYLDYLSPDLRPAFVNEINFKYKGDVDAFVDALFAKSMFTKKNQLLKFLSSYKPRHARRLLRDPAFSAANDLSLLYETRIKETRQRLTTAIDSLQRIYMAGLIEMHEGSYLYPDANFTLRVSYGLVEGYSPADAVEYDYYTTLDGIMEKENPDIYDYVVDNKLKDLFFESDYGDYADENGKMRVAFVASNHTTGGSSGSPVMNADGHLVGINFDRGWEATMSDLMYDPIQGRNIAVDARYVLFIIDKYAGAVHLIEEMTLIK
jgi:hypothetical protein